MASRCGIRFDERCLYLGNLKPGIVKAEVTAYIGREFGVVAREVYPSENQPEVALGTLGCHVEFHNHYDAVQARLCLLERRGQQGLHGHPRLVEDGCLLLARRGAKTVYSLSDYG